MLATVCWSLTPAAALSAESPASASGDCVNLHFVYARASGAKLNDSDEMRYFFNIAKDIAIDYGYSYKTTDLPYEAVSIFFPSPTVALGALASGGEAFKFGHSVRDGLEKMQELYDAEVTRCPDTFWVLGGFSQGAMVVRKSLPFFNPRRFVFAMMLGDPNLYLPEAEDPHVCSGELPESVYRAYAPFCHTRAGILGAAKPYVPEEIAYRTGTWCTHKDFMCGSSHNVLLDRGHGKYANADIFGQVEAKIRSALPPAYVFSYPNLAERPQGERSIPPDKRFRALATFDKYQANYGEFAKIDATGSFEEDFQGIGYE